MDYTVVASFIDYWRIIQKINCKEDEILLFRGHAQNDYRMEPSAFREKKNGIVDCERNNLREIMIDYPESFGRDHMGNLAVLQHYGGKTRLLDFTTNPLISLYIAAEANDKKDGQVIVGRVKKSDILHHTSDKALMLACLPVFSDGEQEEIRRFCTYHKGEINKRMIADNYVMRRFLHEIRRECPAFECEIIGKDLLNNYYVNTYKDTDRIKAQDGLFMIFGLGQKNADDDKSIIKRIDIRAGKKKQILKELKLAGISSSRIYPDLERRAMEISRKKADWIDI